MTLMEVLDPHSGVIYPYLVEATRLKPAIIRTSKGNVHTLHALRQIVKSGYVLKHSPLNEIREAETTNE